MIKRISYIVLALALIATLVIGTACVESNQQHTDTVKRFDTAIIRLPDDEIIEGRVERWMDFEDGDQLQIRIDGTWYLVHSTNVVLISYAD